MDEEILRIELDEAEFRAHELEFDLLNLEGEHQDLQDDYSQLEYENRRQNESLKSISNIVRDQLHKYRMEDIELRASHLKTEDEEVKKEIEARVREVEEILEVLERVDEEVEKNI